MRRPSLCTWKTDFTLFLTVEMHYRTSTRGTRTVRHNTAHCKAQPQLDIMLKITINKCQNHGIPAVQCTEIASHPISTRDQHFCLLSPSQSLARRNPWGCTLLSATIIQYKGSKSLAVTCNQSPSLLGHWQTCTICLIIDTLLLFPFKGLLLICHHLHYSSALFHIPYTLEILHFEFIFSLSNSFHSFSHLIKFCYFTATLLTYKNPCILPYKNEKSLQFSSPIGFRPILHSQFSTSDYLTSVNISKVIFWPYGQLYGHSAPLYIVVQQLWFTHTSDTVSSSTICPQFLHSFIILHFVCSIDSTTLFSQ